MNQAKWLSRAGSSGRGGLDCLARALEQASTAVKRYRYNPLLGHQALIKTVLPLLDEIQKETLLDDLRMIKLQMIGLANTVDDMRLLEQAKRATQSHDTQESMLARLRTFRIRQDQDHQGLGDQEQNGLQTTSFLFAPLPVSAISNVVGDPHMSRGTATFNGRRVLLEWKHYDHGERRAPQIFDIEKRITDLFQLLNAKRG